MDSAEGEGAGRIKMESMLESGRVAATVSERDRDVERMNGGVQKSSHKISCPFYHLGCKYVSVCANVFFSHLQQETFP